jgi:hypothetical protein
MTATAAARARARDVDAVVVEIVRLIATGTYSREALEAIAEREGVEMRQAEFWAASAGRYLRIGPDVQAYAALNVKRLDKLADGADGKVAVAAIAEQNKMLGNHAPQRVEIKQAEQWGTLTDEQRLEIAEEKASRWIEVRDSLRIKLARPADAGTEYVLPEHEPSE